MAHQSLKVSTADFGLTLLRKGINSKDAESVIKNLHTVISNINPNMDILSAQGSQPELVASFSMAANSILADKQKQYEIISNRKVLVQSNVGMPNSLFEQLTEILSIGKILYMDNDTAKLQEYKFSELKKRVRKTSSTSNGKLEVNGDVANQPEA